MKLSKKFVACLCMVGFGWAGCATQKVVPLSNGYQAVTHQYRALNGGEPPLPRIALQRRGTNGTVTPIWPSLYSADTVIHGDLVLFVAEIASREEKGVTHARLFADLPPAPPLDLTDEVLWRWTKANGRDFGSTLQKFASITPVESGAGVEVQLQFWASPVFGQTHEDWPDNGLLRLDWPQIGEIMRAVKTKGVTEKDLRWHTEYIGEKY